MYVWKNYFWILPVLHKYIPRSVRASGIGNNTTKTDCLTKDENLPINVSYDSGNSAQIPKSKVV